MSISPDHLYAFSLLCERKDQIGFLENVAYIMTDNRDLVTRLASSATPIISAYFYHAST